MIDGYGRSIDYLRISLTDRCNLRCVYCMPEEGIDKKAHEDILRFEEILKIVKAASILGIKKIRYTGGEPLILRNIGWLIKETSKIPGIEDIAITTNGILLEDIAEDLKEAGLTRVNISLDTLKEDKYTAITRGGDINKVLRAIQKCISIGLTPVKINTVLIKGTNDDEISDFINLTRELPVEVRFIELMPIGQGEKLYEDGFMSSGEVLAKFPELIPLESNKVSTASLYKLKEAKGKVGFISPLSCKFCSQCNRIRLTSAATIKPCLHSAKELSLKSFLDNEVLLTSVLKESIYSKPSQHNLECDKKSGSERAMYQIGG
ncbi:GTP 3',8-cyclase MoaA [Clostridium sp. CX1]|uniref:GTP 3',8-cyclase n=1 Tax=Clostridium tanneri TaxID=3037988 RepID=A0ABU4JXE4_9CLOT|nr:MULTISPECIES: GTP 3',8-cyclase MoaA [unclassified Clostridium]MCT8976730.1 GTP 3',8-cyclase MoaA [Clostridium sp. CX1]MDW8802828.1 GTP 3',8-cyclase MoaA [Clostridium sp. A1-XYC3]